MALSDPRHRTQSGPFVNAPALSRELNLLCKHQPRQQTHLTMKSSSFSFNLNYPRRIVLLYLSKDTEQLIHMLKIARLGARVRHPPAGQR